MTLSQAGIDYICQNFGLNDCCVEIGLTWQYIIGEETYTENGGSAQIVGRLASGLISSLTINEQTFTKTELDAVNGSPVTLDDARDVAKHSWCYGMPIEPPWNYLAIGVAGVAIAGIGYVLLKKRK